MFITYCVTLILTVDIFFLFLINSFKHGQYEYGVIILRNSWSEVDEILTKAKADIGLYVANHFQNVQHVEKISNAPEDKNILIINVQRAIVAASMYIHSYAIEMTRKQVELFTQRETYRNYLIFFLITVHLTLAVQKKCTIPALKRHSLEISYVRLMNRSILVSPVHSQMNTQKSRPGSPTTELMKHEHARFISFANFPQSSPVHATSLSSAGFFYTGMGDTVRCFSCKLSHSQWNVTDVPFTVHKRLSPNCAFVLEKHRANSFLTRDAICKDYRYTDCLVRISTFSSWPYQGIQNPRDLAEAGFVYLGTDDETCCYSCGVILLQWQVTDSVWDEHAKHSPNCEHVLHCTPTLSELHEQQVESSLSDTQGLNTISTTDLLFNNGPEGLLARSDVPTLCQSSSALNSFTDDMLSCLVSVDTLHNENAQLQSEQKELKVKLKQQDDKRIEQEVKLKHRDDRIILFEEQRLCKICFERDMCMIWLPCHHIMCCEKCSSQLTYCAVCRQRIRNKEKVYILWDFLG